MAQAGKRWLRKNQVNGGDSMPWPLQQRQQREHGQQAHTYVIRVLQTLQGLPIRVAKWGVLFGTKHQGEGAFQVKRAGAS